MIRAEAASLATVVIALDAGEAEDGFDTIRWARALPGANGSVGMWRGSYLAMHARGDAADGGSRGVASLLVLQRPLRHGVPGRGILLARWAPASCFAPGHFDMRAHPSDDRFWERFDMKAKHRPLQATAFHVTGWSGAIGGCSRIPSDIGATSKLFMAGHRIRPDVSRSNFPHFDRNPNTGGAFGEDAEVRRAAQTIFHDAARPSRLVLPVVPR